MRVGPSRRAARVERTLIRQFFDEAPEGAINLGLGQPDLPTPAPVGLAGVRAIAQGKTGYTTTAGIETLRARIAGRYAGFVEGPDQVVIHVGSQQALFTCLLGLVDPDDEVLVPDPGYPGYPTAVRLAGAVPVPYRLRSENGFRLEADDLLDALRERTRAVILCSPSNPTGAVHRADQLQALAEGLERRGVAWISDEVYDGFSYEGPLPSPRDRSRSGVVVSGLSKTLSMTGWRIGWSAGPADVMARIRAVHQYLVTCSPSISQHAALAAFDEPGQAAAARYRRRFHARREVMAEELARVPGVRAEPPDGAFYFFVDVSVHGRSLDVARRILLEAGVITIPGIAFGPGGEGYLRISFAAREDDIRRGIRRVAETLARRGP